MEKEMSIAEIIRGAEETRANGRRLAEERLVALDAERAELKALLGRKRRAPKATGAKKTVAAEADAA